MSPEKKLTEITARPTGTYRLLRFINRIIQFASAAFIGEWALYGILRCPFVVPFVSCQNCPVITCPGRLSSFFWGVWAGWLALALFCGRAFCGWICPGGLLQRILALNPFKINLHRDAQRAFANGKYLALLGIVFVYFCLFQPRVNVPIRTGDFWPSVLLTFDYAFPAWLFRTGLVLAMLALAIFIGLAWCRFACPAGGLFELTKRFALLRIYKDDNCNDCDKCRRSCYMETRPDEQNCTSCGDCLGSCPQDCIHFGRKSGEKSGQAG